eukprot:6198310-Pleurochrysis_carterae.AAC.1
MPRAKLTELGCVQRYQLSREERRRTKARAVGGDARGEGGGGAAAVSHTRGALQSPPAGRSIRRQSEQSVAHERTAIVAPLRQQPGHVAMRGTDSSRRSDSSEGAGRPLILEKERKALTYSEAASTEQH